MSKYGTGFVESDAILAAQEDDMPELTRLLGTMSTHELERLKDAAIDLLVECNAHVQRSKREGKKT